jgi:uncharacterized protein (DUF1800 family)
LSLFGSFATTSAGDDRRASRRRALLPIESYNVATGAGETRLVADREHARLRQRVRDSVTIDFDQTLVADSEVMRDLVQDDASHLAAKQLRVVSVETHERTTVDRDLVRQHPAVVTAASG